MKVIFYMPKITGIGEKVLTAVESVLPKDKIVIYMSIDQIKAGLLNPDNNLNLCVFVLGEKENLKKIISLGILLRKVKIILLLPDRDMETMSLAHKLKPSFIAFSDSDMNDVGQVIKKIVKDREKKKFGELEN